MFTAVGHAKLAMGTAVPITVNLLASYTYSLHHTNMGYILKMAYSHSNVKSHSGLDLTVPQ